VNTTERMHARTTERERERERERVCVCVCKRLVERERGRKRQEREIASEGERGRNVDRESGTSSPLCHICT